MLKLIQLKLVKIKYGADSIGRNIRFEVETLGKSLRLNKKIKAGATVEINQEVGRFETDGGSFQTEVLMTVVEKDLLFNDVGNSKGFIKVNTAITKPQQFTFEVQVRERRSRKLQGKTSAVFEITLEAEVSDAIKYVPNEGDGWLKVILENKHSEESLPAYLKVQIEWADTKREYFTILEGPYHGKLGSVKFKNKGDSWFILDVKHEPIVQVTYSISQKKLILNGRKYKTVDYPEAPWKKGVYDIEIPDYPHSGGARYEKQAPRAKTWFRIGHEGERYLHTGGRSLGCITVIETKRWMEIYNNLIKARKGDFMSVGVLKVVD